MESFSSSQAANSVIDPALIRRHKWWSMSVGETLSALLAGYEGLTSEEAEARRAVFGLNQLEEEEETSALTVWIRQFKSPLIYILLLAAAVTLTVGEFVDTLVIAAVLVLNAVIGFVQERRAERSARALRELVVTRARVMRDSREQQVDARELVPGDMLIVEAGARVPADCRVVDASALEADESLLTGESTTVGKRDAVLDPDTQIADRDNMLFMGSVITRGRGRSVVVATGPSTQLGEIAGSIKEIGLVETPIQQRMARFARVIGLAVLAASAIGFGIGFALGEDPQHLFLTFVALAVAAIPEGLPIVLTVTLSIGVNRMARRHVIIRRLPAVETLGSCSVIGSDKTGTLTQNRMTVQRIYAEGRDFTVTGSGHGEDGEIIHDGNGVLLEEWPQLRLTLIAGALSNDATISRVDGGLEAHGDPTEIALLISAYKAGLTKGELEKEFPRGKDIPFDPELRYSASFHASGDGTIAFVKGAPEQMVDMCAWSDPAERERVLDVAHRMAGDGLRVLAMASKEYSGPLEALGAPAEELSGLTFLGLQAMIDPPREEAIAAVRGCQEAGIRVVMITGDHAVTGLAIARKLGIARESDKVLTGADLDRTTDDELEEAAQRVPVYARVSPQHKLRVVNALQRTGSVVAVTGDGVNDAPALRAADIGVAMGKSGTDVAKEAADMVITDDNFASIFAAVEEGRIVFENVRKVTFFLIATGLGTVLAVLASIMFRFELPFLPAQLLWLNLVTNGIQDVALAFEPGEEGVLQRPPRSRREGVISGLLWIRTAIAGTVLACGTLLLFLLEIHADSSIEYARTVALTTAVLFQVFHLQNARSERRSAFVLSPLTNRFLFVGTAIAVAIHIAAIYLPPTQFVLKLEPVDAITWVKMIAVASTVVLAVEAHKLLTRRSGRDDRLR